MSYCCIYTFGYVLYNYIILLYNDEWGLIFISVKVIVVIKTNFYYFQKRLFSNI